MDNNAIQIIGIIVAALVAFIVYLFQRRRKALTYSILTNSSLISVSEEVEGDIQILYAGKPINQVRLVEIYFENSGNLPILPEDYKESVLVNFPEEAKILSAEIVDQSYETLMNFRLLKRPASSNSHKIVLSQKLLNPKDNFVLKVLLGESDGNFMITGRIVGVSKISHETSSRYVVPFRIMFFIVVVAGFIYASEREVGSFTATLVLIIGFLVWAYIETTFFAGPSRQKQQNAKSK